MASDWKIFRLLLWKNFIVRKRHWILSLLVQIFIPLTLFTLIQLLKDNSADRMRHTVNSDKHYPISGRQEILGSFPFSSELYFTPKNPFTEDLIRRTVNCLIENSYREIRWEGFSSENKLVEKYTSAVKNSNFSFDYNARAVVFKNSESSDPLKLKHLVYKIRDPMYGGGFSRLAIQTCLDESFLNTKILNTSFASNISVQQMPDLENKVSMEDEIYETMFAVTAITAFLLSLLCETTYPANEKILGVNTLMSMNGVKNYKNLLSWLISGLLFSILYILPRLILLNISFGKKNPTLYFGNNFLVAVMHFVHIAHLLTFGYHVSSYFTKSTFRSVGVVFLYFGSFGLQMYLVEHHSFTVIPYLGIFFPNILLYRIYQEIFIYERSSEGVGWNNFFLAGDMEYKTAGSMGFMLILAIHGILLHFFLALYVSSIFPGKYGVAKHPLFFSKIFKSRKVCTEEELYNGNHHMEGTFFEPVSKDAYVPGIQIRNLKKSYITNFRTKKHALRGISIDFYQGQITTLLGHNGAGKTTMMSILTGMLSPTEGLVFMNGKNIADDMDQIITDVGLCPQEDILFPDLNVFEQIQFFGLLKNKNKTNSEVIKDINDLLQNLKITEKRNEIPKNLSGGQKRRVCLGMALIGDASTLILDEPTSGMDPETRREAWDILLKMRGEKTILISTHNMEEADVLGDRTAIIELGKLKSYGTPMFLKKLYGEGNMEVTLSTEDGCDVGRIKDQFSEESQLTNSDGGKLVFSIPYSDKLPETLDRIEEIKTELGVTGLSVSLITLEQVFLRATNDDVEKAEVDVLQMEKLKKVEGSELLLQSAMALFRKKFDYLRIHMFTSLLMILIPLVGIFFISYTYDTFDDTDEIFIRLDSYNNPEAIFSSNVENCGKIYKTTVENFSGKAINVSNKFSDISEAILQYGNNTWAASGTKLIAAANFEICDKQKAKANALYSANLIDSLPLSFNLVSNTIIKAKLGEDYQIDVSKQKFPKVSKNNQIPNGGVIFNIIRVVLLILCLFTTFALYVIYPLRESSSGIKDLQRMTGVTSCLYWGTFFLFDFLFFAISAILMLVGFYCMDAVYDLQFFHGTEIGIMFLLLILLALNSLPFVYIFSFLGKTNTAISILSILHPVILLLDKIFFQLAGLIFSDQETLEVFRTIMRNCFMLLPSVSFFYGQSSLFETGEKNANCRKRSNGICKNSEVSEYFRNFEEEDSLEKSILYLCLTPVLYFIILGLLEHKIIPKLFRKKKESIPINNSENIDDQVKMEKSLVASEINKLNEQGDFTEMQERENMNGGFTNSNAKPKNSYIYLAYELSKHYGNLPAVKEISFSVKKSECFGLLGVNGAGKSTTFRMLTGKEFVDNGIMYLNGKEISRNRKEYLAQMGYCPQNSALIKSFNSKDHLKIFAALRGVPRNQVSSEVEKWINRMNLNLCANQPSGTYSGGNKRRLSIAIALIGNPSLVLLDEPTTGVDPAARRSLWRVIKSCQMAEQSIILTSHSMEECEALCNRLVIMVKGQLVCIGPSEQLKQRFGAGYDINIKLNPERSDIDVLNIKKAMEDALECELRDEHVGYITYHVINSKTKWTTMYGTMTYLKRTYSCIEDFSVLSATLEQLFLQFARAKDKAVKVQISQLAPGYSQDGTETLL